MSWKAQRFQKVEGKGIPCSQDVHHVPPRHPDPQPKFVMKVDKRHHAEYHMLFSAASSFEDACEILKKDWWTPPAEQEK